LITISGLYKRFEGPHHTFVEVLRDINLEVPDRTITAVIGPSGAGKTTLSKCISLLERPTSGSVLVNGKNLSRLTGAALRNERRTIGTIFQSSALLRRKTAAENIALPLEYLGVVRADINRRVAELLEHVGITDKADSYPGQLSGGQRQRVGIARALALHPQVLLSDEATSGLDPQATASILTLLRNLRDQLGLSIILITHEMDVVRNVADRVAVLRAGEIVENGGVRELISDPRSAIGRQLLPIKPSSTIAAEQLSFEVTYGTHANVPPDWISLAGEALHARVSVLGAVIEEIDGRTAGRLLISLAFNAGARRDPESVERYLQGLGLVVSLYDRYGSTAQRTAPEVTSGAA
jgi:D-methionine transport system ATP-binding protein